MPEVVTSFLATYNAVIVFVAINGVLAYSMYAVLIAGQLSLAQAAFASIAAYTSALLTIHLGWPLLAVTVAGVLAGALAAFLLGLPVLRLRGVFLAIATLGFGEMVRILVLNLEVTGGAQGLRGIPKVVGVWQSWLALAVCAWFFSRLGPSRRGLGLAALRQDETAASAMGVDVVRYRMFAFVVSGAIAGLSGVLFAHFTRFIASDQFGFSRAVEALLYAIVGGTGHWIGPVLGGTLLTGLPEVQRTLGVQAGWLRPFINGLILLVVILFLPGGLSGVATRVGWLRRRTVTQRSTSSTQAAATVATEVTPSAATATVGPTAPEEADDADNEPVRVAAGPAGAPVVVLEGLVKDYGGVRAVDEVDLCIPSGEVMGLIGPNGAGKTTLVNVLTGLTTASGGRIEVLGTSIAGHKAHEVAQLGVGRTFQQVKLFDTMSVLENVLVGSHSVAHHTFLRRLFLLPSARRDEQADLQRAWRCLRRVGLADAADLSAGALSYGDRRRLEIARALASEPQLLVLDEPAAGMNRVEAAALGDLVGAIAATGVTILLIEHNVPLVMRTCSRVAVLDFGRLIAEGKPAAIARDPAVIAAYLGDEDSGATVPAEPNGEAHDAGESLGQGEGSGEVSDEVGKGHRDHGDRELTSATLAGTTTGSAAQALVLEGLSVSYGPVEAVRGVDLSVATGSLVSLIGANGAGKSSTLAAISGIVRPTAGTVVFDGQDITSWSSHQRVAAGIVQVPEGREILVTMTVRENLQLGGWHQRDDLDTRIDEVVAKFPVLADRMHLSAGSLSGGEQQMLAIARALLARPRVLLLDEPSMGLAPMLVDEVFAVIDRIRQDGTTVLLVEQNAHRALVAADHGYVMESGEVVLDGPAQELLSNAGVIEAYLGESFDT